MTPAEITTLSQSIVKGFVDSLPQVLTRFNQQRADQGKNRSSGRSNYDDLENDLFRDTARRIKREKDITNTLTDMLLARNKELKNLTSFNDQMVKLIKKTGTFNNDTARVVDDLRQSFKKGNHAFTDVFDRLSDVSISSKKISEQMKKSLKIIQDNDANSDIVASERVFLNSLISDQGHISMLLQSLKNDTMTSAADKAKFTKYLEDMRYFEGENPHGTKDIEGISLGNTDDIAKWIANMEEKILSQLHNRGNDFGSQKKDLAILDSKSSLAIQKLEHILDYANTYGDKFGELPHQEVLQGGHTEIDRLITMFKQNENKTPAVVKEFTDTLKSELDKLAGPLADTLKAVEDNTKKMKWEELTKTFKEKAKEGDVSGAVAAAKAGLMKKFADVVGPELMAVGKVGAFLAKQSKGGLMAIAEDQRMVQKFGVSMNSILTNMDDAVSAGLSPAQMAEWKFQNRLANNNMGGEAAGTKQMRNFMTVLTGGTDSVRMSVAGSKPQSFSEIVGGDSQHQIETYSAIVTNLIKNGIAPTQEAIVNAVSRKGALYETAYMTGMLMKDVVGVTNSLTDSSNYNAYAMMQGTEATNDNVLNMMKLGYKMTGNTEATANLTKQLYTMSNLGAVDLIKRGIGMQYLAKTMGMSENDQAVVRKVGTMQGAQAADYLGKNRNDLEAMARFATLKAQSDINQLRPGGGINMASVLNTSVANAFNQVQPLLDVLAPLINNVDKTKTTLDPTQANNKFVNDLPSVAAQEVLSKLIPAMDNIVTQALYAGHALQSGGEMFAEWASKLLDSDKKSLGGRISHKLDVAASKIAKVQDSYSNGTPVFNELTNNEMQYKQSVKALSDSTTNMPDLSNVPILFDPINQNKKEIDQAIMEKQKLQQALDKKEQDNKYAAPPELLQAHKQQLEEQKKTNAHLANQKTESKPMIVNTQPRP